MMKVNSKKKFEVKYWFLKPLSQNFEVFTPCGDVINPKLALKRTQTHISYTNGDRKMKIKSKRNFQVRNFFIEILKFKAHNVMPSSQNWVEVTQFVYHVKLVVKISKSGHIITTSKKFF